MTAGLLAYLSAGAIAYRPFLHPLPVWDYWVWLLLPLCFGISLVYKSVRLEAMRRVPGEAFRLTVWIVVAMAVAALALLLDVKAFEQ